MRPLWILVLSSLPALAHGQESAEADLLSDAELVYEVSGGFAGVVRTARLFAKAGDITAEYASSEGRGQASLLSAPLERSRYLKLWEEAERAGIWTAAGSGKAKGADMMRHELRARAGERRHTVSWTDGEAASPSTQNALRIGELILALAREATTER
jgi:hypothetical protein